MEVSPYIHPLFKIAMSRSNGLGVKDVVKLHASDVSQSSWVFVMELCCEFWCRNFRSELPGIVSMAISFPLNEILESSLVSTTVEYLLYFPLCFSVDDYRQWVIFHFLACYQVIRGRSELHYVEYRMELLYLEWQP